MKTFFEPSGVVIVGASDNPSKPPYYLIRNLIDHGYEGEVFLVNPRIDIAFGRHVYPEVTALPGPVDLAMILLPRHLTPDVISQCAEKGIRRVIIGAGGFAEKDEEGKGLMEEIVSIAKRFDIRVMGPNSIGVTNTLNNFTTAFIDAPIPNPGPVSLITQTGAVGGPMLHWLNFISKTACIGNRSDVDADELLSYFADDPDTGVVGVHTEGLNDPRAFIDAVRKCDAVGKPLVLLKAGDTAAGAHIAASHTATIKEDYQMLPIAARQAGAVIVKDFEDFFDTLKTMAAPWSRERDIGVGVVSISGAALVLAGDASEALGLKIANAAGEGTCVPGKALYDIGTWSGEMKIGELYYETARRALMESSVTHCLIYLIPTPELFNLDPLKTFSPLKNEFPDKAIMPCIFGHREIAARWSDALEAISIPCYSSVSRALNAIARLKEWQERKI